MKRQLVLALPKGRIIEEAATLFAKAGYDLSPALSPGRKLIVDCGELRVLLLRSADIMTYVAHGAADVGVVGSDVLGEACVDVYQPLDLGIGKCRMIVAERQSHPIDENSQIHLRIGSKYPRTTAAYLARKGITAEIIALDGAIELAPLTGLCDRIVDITQTGETLRQNGLREIDTVAEVSTRLIANLASYKLDGGQAQTGELATMVHRLAAVL